MKAMILAAGFGTRLRPLTDTIPKALVEVAGVPMLERLIRRLIQFGIHEIIINVHHLPEMIESFLQRQQNFGIHIELSREAEILGTGGGIRQAQHFFTDGQPFLVHNVDILTDVDLAAMLHIHQSHHHIATVAVKKRTTSRYFLVDELNRVCGHVNYKDNNRRVVIPNSSQLDELAFSGIHIMSPEIFQSMPAAGFFSIVDVYMQLAEHGLSVGAFRMDDCYWRDLGKLESIQEAEKDLYARAIRFLTE
jgi:NDP-sugar pyrophosphorylase family protein